MIFVLQAWDCDDSYVIGIVPDDIYKAREMAVRAVEKQKDINFDVMVSAITDFDLIAKADEIGRVSYTKAKPEVEEGIYITNALGCHLFKKLT